MYHFIVEIKYKAHIDEITRLRPAHREYLDKGYSNGMILMSGPQTPQIGGVIIARAESMKELAKFLENDPYRANDAADYTYIQFSPRNAQPFLKDWVAD